MSRSIPPVRDPDGFADDVREAMHLATRLLQMKTMPSYEISDGIISNVIHAGIVDGRQVHIDAKVGSTVMIRVDDESMPGASAVSLSTDMRRDDLNGSHGIGLLARIAETVRILDRMLTQDLRRLTKAETSWAEAIEVVSTWLPMIGAQSVTLTAPSPWGPLAIKPYQGGRVVEADDAMRTWLAQNVRPMLEVKRTFNHEWSVGPAQWSENVTQMRRSVVDGMRTMSKHPEAFR